MSAVLKKANKGTIKGADIFCGAGGASNGLEEACKAKGYKLDLVAVNHWQTAVDTHSLNHPTARHYVKSLDRVHPRDLVPDGYLDVLLAGVECTNHSASKGNKPLDEQSRESGWKVVDWISALNVRSFIVENVPRFQKWGPLIYSANGQGRPDPRREGETYNAWLGALRSFGFNIDTRILDCADFGEHQSRPRLFVIGKRDGAICWPEPTHSRTALAGKLRWRAAEDIIDWSVAGKSIFDRPEPLVENTLRRIEVGIKRFGWGKPFLVVLRNHADVRSLDEPVPTVSTSGNHFYLCKPFLIKYYGTNTVSPITEPVPAVTTRDRFALIEPRKTAKGYDILYRILLPHELARAQGFPDSYKFAGTKTEIKKQIGNAWPNRLAKVVCEAVLS